MTRKAALERKKETELKAALVRLRITGAVSLSAGEHWHCKDIIATEKTKQNNKPWVKYCKDWQKKRDLVKMTFASEDKASGAVNTLGSEVRAPDKKALILAMSVSVSVKVGKKQQQRKQNKKKQDVSVNAAWKSLVGI